MLDNYFNTPVVFASHSQQSHSLGVEQIRSDPPGHRPVFCCHCSSVPFDGMALEAKSRLPIAGVVFSPFKILASNFCMLCYNNTSPSLFLHLHSRELLLPML